MDLACSGSCKNSRASRAVLSRLWNKVSRAVGSRISLTFLRKKSRGVEFKLKRRKLETKENVQGGAGTLGTSLKKGMRRPARKRTEMLQACRAGIGSSSDFCRDPSMKIRSRLLMPLWVLSSSLRLAGLHFLQLVPFCACVLVLVDVCQAFTGMPDMHRDETPVQMRSDIHGIWA